MNRKKLEQLRYDRTKDPRKIMITDSTGVKELPPGRCYCCARIFMNAKHGIAYCLECDELMSCCQEGPQHDYDYFVHPPCLNHKTGLIETPPNPLDQRNMRVPVPFDMEAGFVKAAKENLDFKLASGKPVEIEEESDEKIKRLYDLR